MKALDVDGYLNSNGDLRVTLRQGAQVPHSGRSLAHLDRAQVEALMADLQAALNLDDTLGDNEGG
jgi:hypothetical protein